MKNLKTIISYVLLALVCGCAGMNRGCSVFIAEEMGCNWVIVQYDMNLVPKHAWALHNTSVVNEAGSDGIHWLDAVSGHLVHISGWYNRVQVQHNDFKGAGELLGVDADLIQNGVYPASSPTSAASDTMQPAKIVGSTMNY
jgi:hypothetical protein